MFLRLAPRSLVRSMLAASALVLFGAAFAQTVVISPRSIVVNPVPAFDLEVWVDKDRSGRESPTYDVGESIRISVRSSVDALGYVPNGAARQLAGGRTSRLAVVVPDVTNPYFGALVQAAQRRADDDDELVVLADTGQRPQREVGAVRAFAGDVDGIVLCGSIAPVGALREAAGSTPLVSVNRRMRAVPSVVIDQSAVVDLAVDHLRQLGHDRIAFVRGPSAYWSVDLVHDALAGRAPDDVALTPDLVVRASTGAPA